MVTGRDLVFRDEVLEQEIEPVHVPLAFDHLIFRAADAIEPFESLGFCVLTPEEPEDVGLGDGVSVDWAEGRVHGFLLALVKESKLEITAR